MRYKCTKEMCLPKCDGDDFEIPNEYGFVTVGSIWERDDRGNLIGGDVHLDSLNDDSDFGWIKMSSEELRENFVGMTESHNEQQVPERMTMHLEKAVLENLNDSRIRAKYLYRVINDIRTKTDRENGDECADIADNEITVAKVMQERIKNLEREKQKILSLIAEAEMWISEIENPEMRMIFSLRYVEDLNWVAVAGKMNELYKKKKYTESSCRQKHKRFLKKF